MKANILTSLQHPTVKHLTKVRTNRDYRYQQKTALVTGLNLIKEIIPEVLLKVVIIHQDFPMPDYIPKNAAVFQVTSAILKKISGLENPEPLLIEVAIPAFKELKAEGCILVLDGVSDPGNLGALMRTALALGWQGVFFAPNCTDPFNDKAIRAAKGATFKLPLQSGSWEDLERFAKKNKAQVLLGDIAGEPISSIKFKESLLLILSNESLGPSDAARAISLAVSIPMDDKMESLNVAAAGAILMYEIKTRRQ